jgi:hypothetical protein
MEHGGLVHRERPSFECSNRSAPIFKSFQYIFSMPVELNDLERGWFAGLLDGEGCISVSRDGWKQRGFTVFIKIASTSKELIDKIDSLIKGSRYQYQAKGNRKLIYHWTLKKQETVLWFLEQIKDCLIIKKRQALLVHNYLMRRKLLWDKPRNERHYTKQDLQTFMKMKVLNKRGK